MRLSPDAERIMRLPFRHHSLFAEKVEQLAADPAMTFEGAIDVLCQIMADNGVTELDLEMVQPGTAQRLPFAPAQRSTTENEFVDSINAHISKILSTV